MPIEVKLPSLSSDFESGTIAGWLKEEGDSINKGDLIAEVETDKAVVEIEAENSGILGKILVPAGSENVPVDTVLALLLEEGESSESLEDPDVSSTASASNDKPDPPREPDKDLDGPQQEESPEKGPQQEISRQESNKGSNGRVFASPLARRIAAENEVDLSSLKGRGPNGRILKADVEEAGKSGNSESLTLAKESVQIKEEGYTEIPHSKTRRVIAKRLTESKQSIPHFYLTVDCDIEKLLQLRKQVNEELEHDNANTKVSVNDFIVKAASLALRRVPDANASWSEDAIRRYKDVDISVAVAAPGGLITPVVRCADRKGLLEISQNVRDLADRARSGKLTPNEYQGGGFTISNLGMYGVKEFSAIINPPQSCILAVGAGQQRPVVKDGELAVSTLMTCTLSVDHRAVDGAIGAEFLSVFKRFIESPLRLLMDVQPHSPGSHL